jgi:diacylglycerol kinase (ATP)
MKFLRSLKYAVRGIGYALSGSNLRIQLGCASVAAMAGFYYRISTSEWLIIVLCIGSVLSAELMNTAIEKIADFIHPQKDERIGQLKDIAAGAVLLSAIASLITALIIFVPHMF